MTPALARLHTYPQSLVLLPTSLAAMLDLLHHALAHYPPLPMGTSPTELMLLTLRYETTLVDASHRVAALERPSAPTRPLVNRRRVDAHLTRYGRVVRSAIQARARSALAVWRQSWLPVYRACEALDLAEWEIIAAVQPQKYMAVLHRFHAAAQKIIPREVARPMLPEIYKNRFACFSPWRLGPFGSTARRPSTANA